jgi:hypothetical protein
MKPIPETLQQGGDSSERVDRDFVFTRGREMDSNETPVAVEFTK